MKLCRIVHNISLYKMIVFFFFFFFFFFVCLFVCLFYCCFRTLVAMATLIFHTLIMGKMQIGIYCYFIADILAKVFEKCLLSGPLPNVYVLSKPLNLIGCHGNQKAKFATNIQKSTPEMLYGR